MQSYRPWNEEDREQLLIYIEEELEPSEIAEMLDRTEGSIAYETHRLIVDGAVNGRCTTATKPSKACSERKEAVEAAAVEFLDRRLGTSSRKGIWDAVLSFQKELKKVKIEQPVAHMRINTDKWIGIAFQGDLHLGNMATNYEQLLIDKELIKNNDNVYLVINGDYCDNYIAGSHTGGAFEALFPPAVQKDMAKDYIEAVKDKVLALVAGCFMKGSKVTMADGQEKNIEDVDVGDMVISEDGLPQRVTKRYSNYHDGKTIKILSDGNNEPLHVTCDHPCLVLKKEDTMLTDGHHIKRYSFIKDNLKKMRADQIEVGDYVCSPIPRSKKGTPSTKFKDYKYDIDIPFLRLAGYWLAEGSYHKYKDNYNSLEFSFGRDDIKHGYIDETIDILKSIGVKCTKRDLGSKNVISVTAKDKELSSMFYELFGEYSDEKFIHPEILAQPPIKLIHLANTFANGDGCTRKQNGTTDVTMTTVSRDLAHGLSFALTKAGVFHSSRQQKRPGTKKDDYQINFGEESLGYIADLLELHKEDRSKTANASKLQKRGKEQRAQKVYDGYMWHRVTKIEEENFKGFVYNVTVNETSQLVVNKRLTLQCHDLWSLKIDDFDLTEYLSKHGNAVYLGSGGDLFLQVGSVEYKIKMRHKYRFNSSDNATHTVKKMFEKEGGFDVGVLAHNHIAAMEECVKEGLDGNLKRIFLRSGSYKTTDRYSSQMGFSDAQSGVPIVLFNPATRDMRGFQDLSEGINYLKYLNKG